MLQIYGVPEAQFSGDAITEPVQDRQAIGPLRGRRETQQLDRLKVLEQALVRRRGRVVELVHNHDVEVVGCDLVDAAGIQALDRGEDVLEIPRPVTTNPLLTEGGFT